MISFLQFSFHLAALDTLNQKTDLHGLHTHTHTEPQTRQRSIFLRLVSTRKPQHTDEMMWWWGLSECSSVYFCWLENSRESLSLPLSFGQPVNYQRVTFLLMISCTSDGSDHPLKDVTVVSLITFLWRGFLEGDQTTLISSDVPLRSRLERFTGFVCLEVSCICIVVAARKRWESVSSDIPHPVHLIRSTAWELNIYMKCKSSSQAARWRSSYER